MTNCPNCAAPIEDKDKCPYCGTVFHFPTELDLGGFGHMVRQTVVLKWGESKYAFDCYVSYAEVECFSGDVRNRITLELVEW